MITRGITKRDFDTITSVLDRWWGGPAGERAHPIFFYELGEHALIAEEDGVLVGFLLGFITSGTPRTGYVHLVGIHPEYRRRAVGKLLYAQFAERAQRAGAERVKAITTVGNEGSVRFHEALGFQVDEDPSYAGEGRARIVFTRAL